MTLNKDDIEGNTTEYDCKVCGKYSTHTVTKFRKRNITITCKCGNSLDIPIELHLPAETSRYYSYIDTPLLIKEVRALMGINQEQLAAYLCVSRAHISQIERGSVNITRTMSLAIECIARQEGAFDDLDLNSEVSS
ncbi:helix-turn-helix domain-containing protein [Vibrio astriarenae]